MHRSNPEEVREARQASRLTQVQLAERLGVTPRTIQRWEAGASHIPKAAWLLLKQLVHNHKEVDMTHDTELAHISAIDVLNNPDALLGAYAEFISAHTTDAELREIEAEIDETKRRDGYKVDDGLIWQVLVEWREHRRDAE